MELLNMQVKHKVFGTGKVTDQVDTYVEVNFADGKRRFVYPDAFGEFLTLLDEEVAEEVAIIKEETEREQRIEEERIAREQKIAYEKEQRRLERERLMRNHRLSPVSQVAFWVEQEEISQIFEEGRVFTGVRKSGEHEGKPNRLVRLHQNSACIITVREPDWQEGERHIAGIFMVDEGFIGRLCEDGFIRAHPKYRLLFSQEEAKKLLFWTYYVNERYPQNMTWNSGRSRYFDNIWGAQMLQDILQLKKGTEEEELVADFLEHFCHMNQLDEEDLPQPNGTLMRLGKAE